MRGVFLAKYHSVGTTGIRTCGADDACVWGLYLSRQDLLRITESGGNMSASHVDRRKHSRLELKAYGFRHVCRVQHGGRNLEVHLIDISPGGARIRFLNGADTRPAIQAAVYFDTMLNMNGVKLNGLGSSVRWVSGDECGLMFERELELAASDLQLLLNPA